MSSPNETGPPSKECPDAREFIEHKPHQWFKEQRPDWKFWCDGILPVDEQPPCQFFISPERPECGEPSPTTIHVKTPLVDARIDVCRVHKAAYDSRSAEMRNKRREKERHSNLPKAS